MASHLVYHFLHFSMLHPFCRVTSDIAMLLYKHTAITFATEWANNITGALQFLLFISSLSFLQNESTTFYELVVVRMSTMYVIPFWKCVPIFKTMFVTWHENSCKLNKFQLKWQNEYVSLIILFSFETM